MTPGPDIFAPGAAPDDIASAWVARLAAGTADEGDMARLKAWLAANEANRTAFHQARAIWQGLSGVESELRAARPPALLASIKTARRNRRIGMGAMTALAAGLALAVVFGDSFAWLFADHHTSTGEISRLALPDGTVAWLDTQSALDVRYSAGERRVKVVSGRVWFDVKHDAAKPFRVEARDAVASDVGTAFSVALKDHERAALAVDRGAVRVEWHGETLDLTSGRQADWSAIAAPVNAAYRPVTQPEWTQGRLTLNRRALRQALAEIERYRGGRILLMDDAAARRPVSGVLYLDRLDAGLDALAANQGLTVLRLPYVAILYRRS